MLFTRRPPYLALSAVALASACLALPVVVTLTSEQPASALDGHWIAADETTTTTPTTEPTTTAESTTTTTEESTTTTEDPTTTTSPSTTSTVPSTTSTTTSTSTTTTTTTTVPRTVPSAPRSLTATPAASGQARLTWLAPTSNGGAAITDYIIERSANSSTGWITVNDGVRSTTGYTVTGLTNGTRVYFRVRARNAAGNSAASNVPSTVPRTVPSAPRSLSAVPGASGQARLTWYAPTSNGGAAITDYLIQRSANGRTGWVTINDGVRATTGYSVTGLTNGTRVYFRVIARNAAGNSAASNVPSTVPRTVPSAPRNLAASPAASGQARLTWLAPTSNGGAAITDYLVQRSPNGRSGWVSINDGVRATTGYTITGLTNGTRVYFRVIARNAAGNSAASNIVSTVPRSPTPPPPPPPPPPRRCEPSYPTICIPLGSPDLDCGDISHRRFPVRQPDPHRFDGDHDGIGCES